MFFGNPHISHVKPLSESGTDDVKISPRITVYLLCRCLRGETEVSPAGPTRSSPDSEITLIMKIDYSRGLHNFFIIYICSFETGIIHCNNNSIN